jgi:uncharacterized protein (TIGR03067 family)
MRLRFLLILLVLPLVVAADDRREDATKKDLKRLQGTWAFVRIEEEGVKKSQRELKGMEDRLNWTFTNNQLVRNLGMEFAKAKFKLDATKEPKEIDLFDYAAKGKTVLGIYTFQGEFLKIALGSPQSGERPTAFDTPPKSGRANFIMKRHVVQIKDS